jgi:hypothetical protein
MRRVFYRSVAVGVMSFILTSGAVGLTREGREPRARENPIVKFVKRVVRTLGDGIIVPTPAPKP